MALGPGLVIVVMIAGCRLNFDERQPRTIRATVIGDGAIISDPPGLACLDQCEAEFAGTVTLTVTPAGPLGVSAWSGAPCSGKTCVLEGTEDQDVTVELAEPPSLPEVNRVFVTASASNAALKQLTDADGLAAGDRLCNQAAAAAGLEGRFVAFLSSDLLEVDAIDRLGVANGWVRTDGAPVFVDRAAITKLEQLHPIDRDEAARPITANSWLGGSHTGTRLESPFNDCEAYAATPAESIYVFPSRAVGNDHVTSSTVCTALAHLTCFQVDNTQPIDPPSPFPLGRYLFVSDELWLVGRAIDSADAQCKADAERAGLQGDFVAALATKTRTVESHVGGLKGPWRRPDGIVVSLDVLGDPLLAPFNRTAAGAVRNSPALIGAPSLQELASENCDDWIDPAQMRDAAAAWPFETAAWLHPLGASCSFGRLLCLERAR